MLAVSKCKNGKIEARVHPVFLPNEHPLSGVKGSFNALFMNGDNVDDIMLYGRGAGALPTGSAIVSDIVFAAKQDKPRRFYFEDQNEVIDNDFALDFTSKYYIRLVATDEEGNLSKIAGVFGKNNISINTVVQKDIRKHEVPIIFITHATKESIINRALAEIQQLSGVESIATLIRVED